MNIRVCKEFTFEMAHALYGHDGPCKNIHGHSYKLSVVLLGSPKEKKESDFGMVMDFSEMKEIINQEVVHHFDHSLVINKDYPHAMPDGDAFGKVHRVGYQPTCENLLIDICNRLKGKFPHNIHVVSIRLRETATSYAEWNAKENLAL